MKFKHGLTTKDWVVAGLLFAGIFALGIIMIASYSSEAGVSGIVNPSIESHYNSMQVNIDNINKSLNAVSQPGGLSLTGTLSVFYTATTSIMNIVLSSITQIPAMFVHFADDFGIPSEVTYTFFAILVAILTAIIIFAILNASKLAGRV